MIKYVIISPVRDEELFLRFTLESVIAQSIRPVEWVLVDDGSRDGTGAILEEYSSAHEWIKVVKRPDRGCRKAGTGVIEAFYDGYSALGRGDWDFIAKLDGDLSFAPNFFEDCFREFQKDPLLGICGGLIYNFHDGVPVPEPAPLFHVRGATKIYARRCWDQLGGLLKAPGWDTLDEIKANMLGWGTRSFPEFQVLHYRPTGAADGTWKDSFKNGRANYISGYHPLFMLLKCLKRLFHRPFGINSAGLLAGYASGYFFRIPQVPDSRLIAYIRDQQIRTITGRSSLWTRQ